MLLWIPLAVADAFVLVRDGTILRAGQQQVKLVSADGAVAMRLLAEAEGMLEVQPLRDASGHCYAGVAEPAVDVVLRIAKDDIWSVTTRDWSDGQVQVRAGTRAELLKSGSWRLTVGSTVVELPVPFDLIADRYAAPSGTGPCLPEQAAPAPRAATVGGRFAVAAGTPLWWPDGSAAGSVAADLVFTPGEAAWPNICIDVSVGLSPLRACLDRKAARPVPVRPGGR